MSAVQNALQIASEIMKNMKGTKVFVAGAEMSEKIDTISSGSLALDKALGPGGLPRGRILEFFGHESSGKTTLAILGAIQAQKSGLLVGIVDAEHAIDLGYAAKLGLDLDKVLITQPSSGEEGLEVLAEMVKHGVGYVIFDSVAALVPQAEVDGKMGEQKMGASARLMSQALRKLAGIVNSNNATVVFINQLRMKIGVMYGNPQTTTGGEALKYYASVRLEVKRGDLIKDGENIIGHQIRVKIVKNKVGTPFKECTIPLLYGAGVDSANELYDMAVASGVLKKNGGTHYLDGKKVAKSKDEAILELRNNQELFSTISELLKKAPANAVKNEEQEGEAGEAANDEVELEE